MRIELQNCFEPESTAGGEEEIVQILYVRRTGSSTKIRSQVLRNHAARRDPNVVIHGIDGDRLQFRK